MADKPCPKYLISDKECVLRAQKGEFDTLRVLYQRYYRDVLRFITRKVVETEDAKDIASKVFAKTVERIDTLNNPVCFQKWLYEMVNNQIRDYYRLKPAGKKENISDLNDDEYDMIKNIPSRPENPSFESVRDIIKNLSAPEIQIIELHNKWGFTFAEIAEKLGMGESAVKMIEFRAKQKFKKLYLQKYKSPIYLGGEKNEKD